MGSRRAVAIVRRARTVAKVMLRKFLRYEEDGCIMMRERKQIRSVGDECEEWMRML